MISKVPVEGPRRAPKLPVGAPLTLLVWNIQYAAGRGHFFYDGGRQVSSPRARVEATLSQIVEAIRAEAPDLVLLQEVDRGARRTHYLDEHAALARAIDLPLHLSAAYHRAHFVPVPRHEPLGRVNMHLSVFSRYRVSGATRHQLPRLREPLWRRAFNLRRAVLDVRLPLYGGGEIALLNAHLAAFSRGDGALHAQVAEIKRHLSRLQLQGTPWLLGGDFNSLPPGFDRCALPAVHQALYPEDPTPVDPLFRCSTTALSPEEMVALGPEVVGTYAPSPRVPPDRTLDYVFAGPRLRLLDQRPLHQHLALSDHAPLRVRFLVEPRA